MSHSPSCVAAGGCAVDLAFLLDSSGSVCNDEGNICDHFLDIKAFLQEMVIRMKIEETNSRVGLILFGTKANVEWSLDK